MFRGVKRCFSLSGQILWGMIALWCGGVFRFCICENADLGSGLALIYWGCFLLILWFLPVVFRLLLLPVMILPVIGFFAAISPDPAVQYQTPWAEQCEIVIDRNRVTIRGIRDFHYRTEQDYDVRYREETFDINQAETLYLAVSHWDGLENIAHTMLSFAFRDGKYVTLSVETRVPVGKTQNSLAGLFKQYGLGMIFGTESDLLKLRSDHRGEVVYLYRTAATPEQVRNVFLGLASRAQELAEKPEFYNTLTQNCTTTLLKPMRPALGALHKDIRLIANGLIDHMAYELGYLDTEGYQIETAKNRYRIPSGIPGEGAEYSRLLRKVMYQEKEQNP